MAAPPRYAPNSAAHLRPTTRAAPLAFSWRGVRSFAVVALALPVVAYRRVSRGWLAGDSTAAAVVTGASALFGLVVLGPVATVLGPVAPLLAVGSTITGRWPVGPVMLALAWALTAGTVGPAMAWYRPAGHHVGRRPRRRTGRQPVDGALAGLADLPAVPESVVLGLDSETTDPCAVPAAALRHGALVVGESSRQRADLVLRLAGWYARTHQWGSHSLLVVDLEGSDVMNAGLEQIAAQSGRPFRMWVPGAPLPEWTRGETGDHLVEFIVPTMEGVVVVDASTDRGAPVEGDAAVERAAEFVQSLADRRERDAPTDELLVIVHGFARHRDVSGAFAAALDAARASRLVVVLTAGSQAHVDALADDVVQTVRDRVAVTVALRDRDGAESLAARIARAAPAVTHLTHPNVVRHLHDGSAVVAVAADATVQGEWSASVASCRLATHDPCALIGHREPYAGELRRRGLRRPVPGGAPSPRLAVGAAAAVLVVLLAGLAVTFGRADRGVDTEPYEVARWAATFGELWFADGRVRSAGLVAFAGVDVPAAPVVAPVNVFVGDVERRGHGRWVATITTIDQSGDASAWAFGVVERDGRLSLASSPVPTPVPATVSSDPNDPSAEQFVVDDAATGELGPFVVDVVAAWGRGLERDRVFVDRMSTGANPPTPIGGLEMVDAATVVEVDADGAVARVRVSWSGLGSFVYRVEIASENGSPRIAAIDPWPGGWR